MKKAILELEARKKQLEEEMETNEEVLRDKYAKICLDMADRYDADIEGCDADELLAYAEGTSCALRLAYIIKFGKFPPIKGCWGEGSWGEEWKNFVTAHRTEMRRQTQAGLTRPR